jgi:hypothetical protein
VGGSIKDLIPELQAPAQALIDLAGGAGVAPRLTSTVRTNAEQKRLYEAYLRGASRYPAAPPGLSSHEYGWAFDLVVPNPQDQVDLGTVWKSWGGTWFPSDAIHFEYPGFKKALAQSGISSASSGSGTTSDFGSTVASVGDFVLGFLPGVGEVELIASIVALGFPQSEALQFLSSPLETLNKHTPIAKALIQNLAIPI